MKKDFIITGLVFIIIIHIGISIKNNYEIKKLKLDILNVKKIAIELNDKLDNSYSMIDSLNKEITNNWKEIEEYKELKNLKKDLARHTN